MRREPVKKWDVRSFEENYEAALWLNHMEGKGEHPKVESASVDGQEITLVVSYVTDDE